MKKEHFEILLEDIKSKFDLAMEGHQILDKLIDLDSYRELDSRMKFLEQEVSSLSQRVSRLEAARV